MPIDWKPLDEDAPKDRVLLGCWRDAPGDAVPVLIHFDAGADVAGFNNGFVGDFGQLYAEGSLTHYADIEMPDGTIPTD